MTEESTTGKSSYWPLAGIAITALVLGILAASYLKPDQEQASAGEIGGDHARMQAVRRDARSLEAAMEECLDVCPTSLGLLASAIMQLPAEQQRQIQPVFISVDPGRDTPEILEAYANAFYPGMLGLTDKKETIDDVTWKYRALYKIVPMEDSAMGYTVDHSSIIYVIGRNGVIQSLAQHGTTPAELVEKLKHALARS